MDLSINQWRWEPENHYKVNLICPALMWWLQAHGDLVSAVDFSEDYLVTGYEDSNVGVWSMETGLQVQDMPGHNGGVTGIQIQLNLVATSSYDSTVNNDYFLWILEEIVILQVRLWDIERGECVLILHNSDSFCRCVAFHGNIDQN